MRITTEDIRVGFHTRQILKGISIDSGNKELVGIIGPNGSGKSTLLKCIYRVLKADSGAVYLDGDELYSMNAKSSAKKMAVVAQHNYIILILACGRLFSWDALLTKRHWNGIMQRIIRL